MRLLLAAFLSMAALPSLAGMAIKRDHWRADAPITVEVRDANPIEYQCIELLVRDVSQVVPLDIQLGRPGQFRRPKVLLTVMERSGVEGGHSDMGDQRGRTERIVLRLRDEISSTGTFSEELCRTYAQVAVLHEFGHLLGLYHEHQHPDAPAPITEAIAASSEVDRMWVRPVRDSRRNRFLYTPYDISSIMHYFFFVDDALIEQMVRHGGYENYFRLNADGSRQFMVLWFNQWNAPNQTAFSPHGYSEGDIAILQSIYGRPL